MKKLIVLRESLKGHKIYFVFNVDKENDVLILRDVLLENKYSIKDLIDENITQGVYDEVFNEQIIHA